MHVARLPRDPGPAAWNEILGPRKSTDPLNENTKADFLVIGAGFAGLAAARRIASKQPGAKIVVLEAKAIGEGPAGRNSGFMIDLPHDLASEDYAGDGDDRTQTHLNRVAIEFARDAFHEYGLPAEAFDECGKINGAVTAKGMAHNHDYAKHLSAIDEPCELLDAQQMGEITGTDYYHGGLFTPGTVMLQPALWVRGLAAGLGSSVRLFEHSPVTELAREGGAWNVRTPNGTVQAKKVVLAVNGHAESFGIFKHRLVHVILYASMTRPLAPVETKALGGNARWGITPSDPMGTTVRRVSGTGGDRIVIRNQATYAPSMEVTDAQVARMGVAHDRSFSARFPNLSDIDMAYRWGGRLCLSLNSVPAFGEVEEGLHVACCQNGLGTTKGTLAGMLAADEACGVQSPELELINSMPEPKRLPPEPLATIGGKATLAWRQFRAGREV